MNKRQQGFTLLEILAALAVVAIGLTALFSALSQGTRLASRVEERMIGNWVASNVLTELKAFNQWPSPGEVKQEVQMANRTWLVNQKVRSTKNEDIRRVEVEVTLDSGRNSVAQLTSFFLNPRPKLVNDEEDVDENER